MLSRMLLEKYKLPYFSLDFLMMGLINGMDNIGFDGETHDRIKAEKMWPLVKALLTNIYEEGASDYVIEGVAILPKHFKELEKEFPDSFKGCWLGYPNTECEKKLQKIRQFGGGKDDWLRDMVDGDVREVINYGIEYSKELAEECQAEGVSFFDTSYKFLETLNLAENYMLGQGEARNVC